jgi:U3 small nucleolar ribonucleoprotein component
MESALPATAAGATLLAPEEVYKASNAIVGADTSDLTAAKKRALRQKDRKARMKVKSQTSQLAGANKVKVKPTSAADQKDKAREKLIGQRGVTVIGKHRTEPAGGGKAAKDAKALKL